MEVTCWFEVRLDSESKDLIHRFSCDQAKNKARPALLVRRIAFVSPFAPRLAGIFVPFVRDSTRSKFLTLQNSDRPVIPLVSNFVQRRPHARNCMCTLANAYLDRSHLTRKCARWTFFLISDVVITHVSFDSPVQHRVVP